MNGSCRQLLAGAGCARDQDARIGRGGTFHRLPELVDDDRTTGDAARLNGARAQVTHLALEAGGFEGTLGHEHESIRLERLLDEVVGPGLDGGDRRLDVAVARDHHDGQIRVLRFDDFQDLETIETASLQPDVQEDEMRTTRLDGGQGIIGGARRARAVAFILQDAGDQLTNIDFVVDDENISAHKLALRESFRLEAADASSDTSCFVFGIHMRT